MSKEITINNSYGIEKHTWSALKTVVYNDAKDESIKLVIDYCKAHQLDPLQKPVHIVQSGSYNAQNKWVSKDSIWPSIGLYRIQAERSGKYAGLSEPIYGETINTTFIKINKNGSKEEVQVSYPEWCKITVKKIVQGNVVDYTVKEFWLENYAKFNSKSTAPNSMWSNRPFGQLAKCAEAQALRKAFPEIITQQPTAEEMEGKFIEEKDITPKSEVQSYSDRLDDVLLEQSKVQSVELEEGGVSLNELILTHNVPSETIDKWCTKFGIDKIEDLPEEKKQNCIDYIKKEYQQVVTLEEIEEENAGYTYK